MSTVVITGSARGIGAAAAALFTDIGYNVIINYNTSGAEALALCEKITAGGGKAIAVQADVSKMSEAKRLFDEAKKAFGTVDILVNNAGIAQQKLFTDITEADYDRMFDCNVRSVFNYCQCALPDMIHNKYGRIINISSMWGVVGASCEVHYSASKAAVIGMTKALAREVAPSGITVNCIAPGVIDTPMNKGFDEETLAALREETPVGRLGTPEDVARAIRFLADEKSSFITGQTLGIDGGFI
ncbi:MAG: 3-oxoacyl-ACP reductase FabG [Clostridia bacterium]|nr:3-oxoacyl-ACP reductase FabG [Clostridia bacterium]